MRNNIIRSAYVFFVSTLFMLGSCRGYNEDPVNPVESKKDEFPKNPNFITIWEVTNRTDFLSEKKIIIPINPDYKYDYDVKWNKVTDPNTKGEKLNNKTDTHIEFPSAGKYRVEISGTFPAIFFNEKRDTDENNTKYIEKIISIENWGNIEWKTMRSAFAGCVKLRVNAKDAPNLSKVRDVSHMFCGVNELTAPLNHWDVSNVVKMRHMLSGAKRFNQPLNNWNVSNVKDMSGLFFGNRSFDQPLNNWNVSNVTYMDFMFYGTIFNQNINNWNVGNVTSMNHMFCESSFNSSINNWNVSKVTDMEGMFNKATNFNQPLNSWNVDNVKNMSYMFQEAVLFNQSLNRWNVSNSTDVKLMFIDAKSFDKKNVDSWKISEEKKARMFDFAD